MYQNRKKQERYWDKEVWNFDSIYTHKKNKFLNYLDKRFRWEVYARFEYTMKQSQPVTGKSVLDIGCGTGKFALEYGRQKAKEVVGIDISVNMIKLCQQRANNENLNEICTFLNSDPFEYRTNKIFNISIGMGLFDYIIEPLPVIERMKNLTSDRIIISFPKKGSLRAFLRKIRLGLRGCDVHFFYKKDIMELIEKAGFFNYDIAEYGQLFCVTVNINN